MPATPQDWLPTFTANLLLPEEQSAPVVAGLSNGNFVVVWEDHNDDVHGPLPFAGHGLGADLVAVIFNPIGERLTDPIFLNTGNLSEGEEVEPAVAATSDGGFVVAYTSAVPGSGSASNENLLHWSRHDSSGTLLGAETVEAEQGGHHFDDVSIAVGSDDGFLISYQSDNGSIEELRSRMYFADGSRGDVEIREPDFDTYADGSAAVPYEPNTIWTDTAFVGNSYITVYSRIRIADNSEPGRPLGTSTREIFWIETAVDGTTLSGGSVSGSRIAADDFDTDLDRNPRLAALDDGSFVTVWRENNNVLASVLTKTSGGRWERESKLTIAGGSNIQNQPDVIGLEDGGYFIIWVDATSGDILGQRFARDRSYVGDEITVASGTTVAEPRLGLTSDGRILVTWVEDDNVLTKILDPRMPNFDRVVAEVGDGATTSLPGGSEVSGTAEADVIYGHDGATIFNPNVLLGGIAGDDFIYGGAGVDRILGLTGEDHLEGGEGDDLLDGGEGADHMDGGNGRDDYYVDNVGDVIVETFDSGDFDRVFLSVEYNLPRNIETVTVNVDTGLRVTATEDVSTITGGDGDDIFVDRQGQVAFRGDDAFFIEDYDGGFDTVSYELSINSVVTIDLSGAISNGGAAFRDTFYSIEHIIGTGLSDTLAGDENDNMFSGMGGFDQLSGKAGNDTLYGGGGDDALDGGEDNDYLDGGEGMDTAIGGTGDDIFVVDHSSDVVTEAANEGSDIVDSFVSLTIPVNVEVLRLQGTADIDGTGSDMRDIIQGNAGNNTINGAGGFDVMAGGAGNDVYAVDDSYDAVIEEAGGGFDNVYSSVDYIIDSAQEIESAILTGTTAVILRGDDSGNQLFGNDITNVIDGRGGTDFMLGLGGADIFQISREAGAVDVIGDFSKAEGDRMAFTGFDATTTIVSQASATSFEVRDTKGTATLDDDTVQTFQLWDGYDPANPQYTQGELELNVDYYFG